MPRMLSTKKTRTSHWRNKRKTACPTIRCTSSTNKKTRTSYTHSVTATWSWRRRVNSSRKRLQSTTTDNLWRSPATCKRSEEHTSELQSPDHLVCRLLLEKKKKKQVLRGDI